MNDTGALNSMNLRPSFGNTSRGVDDIGIRDRIVRLLDDLVKRP